MNKNEKYLKDSDIVNIKYAEALKNVGISIYDITGELKDIYTIITEFGIKLEEMKRQEEINEKENC